MKITGTVAPDGKWWPGIQLDGFAHEERGLITVDEWKKRKDKSTWFHAAPTGTVEMSKQADPAMGEMIVDAWEKELGSVVLPDLLEYFQRFLVLNQTNPEKHDADTRKWLEEQRQQIQYDDRLNILYRIYRYQYLKTLEGKRQK